MKKIELGEKVKDKVSGLVGTAVSKVKYLNGCIQYGVMPKLEKGKTELVTWNIDEEQLEVVGKPIKIKKKPVGGPTTLAIRRK